VPVLTALALSLAPPVPMPTGGLPDFLPSRGEDEREERSASTLLEERTRALAKQPLKRAMLEERDFAQRAGAGGATSPGDLTAIFKDTSLSGHRPDFNSFLKKGDERLKLSSTWIGCRTSSPISRARRTRWSSASRRR